MTSAGVEKTQPQPCMQVSIVLEYSNKLYQCNPRILELVNKSILVKSLSNCFGIAVTITKELSYFFKYLKY